MGDSTAIAWTDHTFNPWIGCARVSPGCQNCYAEARDVRWGEGLWGKNAPRRVTSDANWRTPLKWNREAEAEGRRHRVFCASLADVFENRPDLIEPRARLFRLIEATPWLDWQLLTKRPENAMRLAPAEWDVYPYWPSNVWLGTTVEDQTRAAERIPHLSMVPAKTRFLSCEPLLGRIDLTDWMQPHVEIRNSRGEVCESWVGAPCFDWVIIGGESGPNYRPMDVAHARDLHQQCQHYGVAVFFKQVGGPTPTAGGDALDGQTYKEFPS